MKLSYQLYFIISFNLFVFDALAEPSEKIIDSIANISLPDVISKSQELIPVFCQNARSARNRKMYKAEAKSYAALRLMHTYLGRYDSATFYSLRSIETYELHGFEKEAAYAYCERGYGIKLEDLELAQTQMLKGLAILKKLKDKQGLAGQYNNYGVIKEFKKELDSAQYYYQLSLDYKYELNDSIGIPYSILNLGVLAGMQKDFTKARDSVKKAIFLFERLDNIPTKAESMAELANLFYQQNDYYNARKTFLKCIKTCESIGYLRLIKECHKILAVINEKTGDLKSSLYHQKQYSQIHDSLINETRVKEISALETKFEVAKKEERIAKQQLKIKDRNNQLLIGLISIGLIGFIVFYYIKRLRDKKKQEKIEYENKMRRERERISKDLHDNIGSQLAFIISGASISKENKGQQLEQISAFAKDTLNQLRTTVWAIKKERISITDFSDQLEQFVDKIKPNSLIEFNLNKEITQNEYLSPAQSVHLFRVIQESISNAIKHSECFSIAINLESKEHKLRIVVEDDGIGFDTQNKKYGNGVGFMKERLEELGGTLEIRSSEKGTIITGTINTTSDV